MDVLSEKGQRKMMLTHHALTHVEANHQDLRIIELDTDYPASVDYLVLLKNRVTGLVEFRVREDGISLRQLKRGDRMILSVDKYNKTIDLANHIGVPSFYWVYLPKDEVLLSWKLHDPVTGFYAYTEAFTKQTRTSVNDERKRFKPCITLGYDAAKTFVSGIDAPE